MGERIGWDLRNICMVTWLYGYKYKKYDIIKMCTYTSSYKWDYA